MKRFGLTAAALGLALLLAACGDPSKAELLKKAENISTKAELESKLGRPDDIAKLGPIEQWIYKAKDGSVIFIISGDSVALQATGGKRE